jgi:hypothetical protein
MRRRHRLAADVVVDPRSAWLRHRTSFRLSFGRSTECLIVICVTGIVKVGRPTKSEYWAEREHRPAEQVFERKP